MSISTQIQRLETARNAIRDKLVSLGLAEATDKLDTLVTVIESIVNRGAVNETLDTETVSYTIPSGYHDGNGEVNISLENKVVTPTNSDQTITPTSGKVLRRVTVKAMPYDISDSTVTPDTLLGGVVAYNAAGERIIGTHSCIASAYTITQNLTDITSNDTTNAIVSGEAYTVTLTAKSGYAISSVIVTMGGVDVTSSVYSNGVVNIPSVTGNIIIAAVAVASTTTYKVTKYLYDVYSSNTVTSVESGNSYTTTLSTDDGYYLYPGYVSVTMGGRDITASAYNSTTKKITISKVTGNIVITAEAVDYENLITEYGEEDFDGNTYYATGLIPISRNNVLYFENMDIYEGDKLVFYNSSGTQIGVITVSSDDDRFTFDGDYVYSYDHNSAYVDGGVKPIIGTGVKVKVYCQYIDEYSIIRKD